MIFSAEKNKDDFLRKITGFENALNQRQLINDRLEVVQKGGFKWRLLCLFRPFLALIGIDLYSHVRVNNVAKSLFSYFKANKEFLDDASLEGFKKKFYEPLLKKTNYKYEVGSCDFDSLLPPLPMKWPADAAKLGLTDSQKTFLEKALSEVVPLAFGEEGDNHTLICSKVKSEGGTKRKLQLFHNTTLKNEFDVPITVKVIRESPRRLSRIMLWSKEIIAKGGERKVKRCYDLMTGEFSVRKKCLSNSIEKLVLLHFKKNPVPGIEPVQDILSKDPGFKSDHIIEPVFEGTLRNLLGHIKKKEDVLSIMQQLLTGLSALHAFTPTEVTIDLEGITTRTFPKATHLDINLSNILLRKSEGKWEAVLIDFGVSGNFAPGNGTIGYLSPAEVKLRGQVYPNGPGTPPIAVSDEFKKKLPPIGQKRDVWALGLIFTSLLTGRIDVVQISKKDRIVGIITPPLQSINDLFLKGSKGGFYDGHLSDLQQDSIDGDIAAWKVKTPDYASLWGLISKMLRVDPEERVSASEALLDFVKFMNSPSD